MVDHAREAAAELPRRALVAMVLATVAVALWGFWAASTRQERWILDESQANAQVQLFLRGEWKLHRWPGEPFPAAATLPGFPLAVATVAAVTGDSSPGALRAYCFGFSLLYAAALYGVARVFLDQRAATLRAAQVYLLPIAFPFHFLLYTDVFSLLLVCAAFGAFLRGHERSGSLLALLAVGVRQTNIVFVVFLWAFALVERHGFRPTWPQIAAHARRCWLLVAAVVVFAIFVAAHGRVNLDNPRAHPLTLSPGNVAFSLALAALLFLPLHVAHARDVGDWLRRRWRAAIGIAVIVLLATLTYRPSHGWNTIDWLLRNDLLALFTRDWTGRLVFGVAATLAALSIGAAGFVRPAAVMLVPLWLVQLLPVLLVEPRYYLTAFTLFLLLRRPENAGTEAALWAWFAVLSVLLHRAIVGGNVML